MSAPRASRRFAGTFTRPARRPSDIFPHASACRTILRREGFSANVRVPAGSETIRRDANARSWRMLRFDLGAGDANSLALPLAGPKCKNSPPISYGPRPCELRGRPGPRGSPALAPRFGGRGPRSGSSAPGRCADAGSGRRNCHESGGSGRGIPREFPPDTFERSSTTSPCPRSSGTLRRGKPRHPDRRRRAPWRWDNAGTCSYISAARPIAGKAQRAHAPHFRRKLQAPALVPVRVDKDVLAEDDADLRVIEEEPDLALDDRGQIKVIGVIHRDELAASNGDAVICVSVNATVLPLAAIAHLIAVGSDNTRRTVRRRVVHDQHFSSRVGLPQNRVETLAQVPLPIENGNDDGH